MSVGVFPFMPQFLVYVREKYRNYSSLFGEGGQGYFRDAVIDHFWCP